ncbi:hypothetical protein ACFYTS_21395 [Nocardia sp. NPDC004151]|uniref:hypothetical protein n=1 Tax=Nocardia sp. NPDC004151 TaxID=3364304 RepID=UPI0036CCC1C1
MSPLRLRGRVRVPILLACARRRIRIVESGRTRARCGGARAAGYAAARARRAARLAAARPEAALSPESGVR